MVCINDTWKITSYTMLNPLLHPNHSSAPTSPVCTRSVLSGRRSNAFVFGGNGAIATAPHSPLVGFHSSSSVTAIAPPSSSIGGQCSTGFVKPVLLRAIPGSVIRRRRIDIQNASSGKQRRLSRIVKVNHKIFWPIFWKKMLQRKVNFIASIKIE